MRPRPPFLSLRSGSALCLAALVWWLPAAPALALQPLADFLSGARRASVDDREAAVTALEADNDALVTLGHALPSFSARGTYTRNQYDVTIPFSLTPGAPPTVFTIQPADQWDAFLELDVPLIDLAAWTRARAAKAAARSASHAQRATLLQVEQQVAGAYYQLVGAEALRRSAQQTLQVSKDNLQLIRDRRSEGLTTELDVNRAAAEVETAKGSIADADLSSELARRALQTLTGLTPEGESSAAEDDLHDEPPLAQWEDTPEAQLPALQAAAEQTQAADLSRRSATFALLPTLSGAAQERFTNATSFVGQPAYYTLILALSWRLDVSTVATLKSQSEATEVARLHEERARLAARDQIHNAWQRVRADIIKSRAARAQVKAAALAAEYARERFAEGAGTQLEVVQAQRDAFGADVARIQADADLSYSRAVLRLAAGASLSPETPQ